MKCEACGGFVDYEHSCDFFRYHGFERSKWLMAILRHPIRTHDAPVARTTAPSAPREDSTKTPAPSAPAVPVDTFDTSMD